MDDGWMDGWKCSLSGRCRHNWESGEEDEPDRHEKEEERVLSLPVVVVVVRVVERVERVERQQGCSASVSVSATCLITSRSFKRRQELRP